MLLLWCAALLYALHTGWQQRAQVQAEVDAFQHSALARIESQRQAAAKAEAGGPTDRYTAFPSRIRAPAVLPPGQLAFLALGELDLMPHTATVSLFSTEAGFTKNQELQSPATLAAGRFDLAFVVVVLLPLVLIALGHTQLAEDRERQRLPLLAAQGELTALLRRRLALRGFAVAFPLVLITGAAAWASAGIQGMPDWLAWTAAALAWGVLWLVLCAVVAGRAHHAGAAAATLVACWLGVVMLLPAALDALLQSMAPPPSPLRAVTATRVAEVEADRQRERILGQYVSDHPELSVSTAQDDLAWTRRYYTQLQYVQAMLAPMRNEAEQAHQRHRVLRDALVWLSPAQVLERSLTRSAGTDASRYRDFKLQLRAFKQSWDKPLLAPLLQGHSLKADDFSRLPRFRFADAPSGMGLLETGYMIGLAALVLIGARGGRILRRSPGATWA